MRVIGCKLQEKAGFVNSENMIFLLKVVVNGFIAVVSNWPWSNF